MRPTAALRPNRRRLSSALLLAGLAAALLAPGGAGLAAQREAGGSARREPLESQPVRYAQVTLDQAIEMAERRFRARVVRAGVEDFNGQRVYVLRLLSEEGRVWTVRVDPQTGSIV